MPLVLFGCSLLSNKNEPQFNTEIVCPNSSYRILILQATKAEVERSILDAIEYWKGSNKKNRYTVLHFSKDRNTSIYNTNPQELFDQCLLVERPRKPYYSSPVSL